MYVCIMVRTHLYPSLPSVALFLHMLCVMLELVDSDRGGGEMGGEGRAFETNARKIDFTKKRWKPLNKLTLLLTVLCLFQYRWL